MEGGVCPAALPAACSHADGGVQDTQSLVPASSEGGDTRGGAASAAFGLAGDPGLSLDAVLLLVLEVKPEFLGAALHEEELLRRCLYQNLVFFCSSSSDIMCACVCTSSPLGCVR